MKQPLIDKSIAAQSAQASGSTSPLRRGGFAAMFGQALLKKVEIKNELPVYEKLPIALNPNFLEENVNGVKYEENKEQYRDIWDTEASGRLIDAKEIFEARRAQYSQLVEKSNLISLGQVVEGRGMIYLGTKDGYIMSYRRQKVKQPKIPRKLTKAQKQEQKRLKKRGATVDSKAPEMETIFQFRESSKIKSQNQKEIQKTQYCEGYLVTYDIKCCVRIYDVIERDIPPIMLAAYYSDDPRDKEPKIIGGFDLFPYENTSLLFIYFNNCIESFQLKPDGGMSQWRPPIETELRIKTSCYLNDDLILVSDKDTNVYMGRLEDQKLCNLNRIREASVQNEIKGLLYADGIATIVVSNNMESQTVLYTVDMELLEKEQEQAKKRQEEKKKMEQQEAEMREKLDEEEFQLWKHKMAQIEASKQAEIALQEAKDKKENKLKAIHMQVLEIGKCTGVSFTKNKDQLLVSGTTKIIIFSEHRWLDQTYEIMTDFKLVRSIFSSDDQFLLTLGVDGTLREVQYRGEKSNSQVNFLEEKEIQDAASTSDGKFFALLSNNQTTVSIYSYENCKKIFCDRDLEYAYLMEFAACSKALIVVMGTENPKDFLVNIYTCSNTEPCEKLDETFINIEEDFIVAVQASLQIEQIFAIARSSIQTTLYVYEFGDPICKKCIRDAIALSLTSDEKLLAYSTKSAQILMLFVKKQNDDDNQVIPRGPRRKSVIFKFVSEVTEGDEFPFEEDEPVNILDMPDIAHAICFYGENQKMVIQTDSCLMSYDIYTHNMEFKVIASVSNFPIKRLNVQFDNFVTYCDGAQSVFLLDVHYNVGSDYINLSTKQLKTVELNFNTIHKNISHNAFAGAGNHIILQMPEDLLFEANPFLHHKVTNEMTHTGPFNSVEGFFIPVLMGGPILGLGPFATLYLYAIEDPQKPLKEILTMPIFPYRLNALHYFAMTGNVEGVEICFKNKVKFIKDVFGKTPLDYAIKTADKLVIEAILKGIYESEAEEKIKIMRTIKLSLLLKHPATVLANLLGQNGVQEPEVCRFQHELSIPTLFPLQVNLFAESGVPYYSAEVAKQLHPPKLALKTNKKRPISTIVLNNPVPNNFTKQSISLLQSIVDCGNDDIVRTVPITLYLNRKWNSFGYQFYLLQFILYLTLLLSLVFLDSIRGNPYLQYPSQLITFLINTYFFLYEMLQLGILGMDYFDFTNCLDLTRLAAIFAYNYSRFDQSFEIPPEILPIIFLFMWFKIISFLSVFKPTRYLIKMIFEILNDMSTFLIVLFSAQFAYAQINYSMVPYEERDLNMDLRNSYVLSLGELGGFDEIPLLNFFIFMVFSFLIPLVLMNMIIALMGDSYTRVQTNAIAADARALAEMELEMEQIIYYLYSKFRPEKVKTNFFYCFQTSINDADGDEDWEGTVGQLKNTINEATENLEQSMIAQIQSMQKKNTEKIVDNLLRANKSELDVIDKLTKLVEKESKDNREHVEEKLLEESTKVKKQFDHTHNIMDEESTKVTNQFNTNSEERNEHFRKVCEEFKKTQEQIQRESEHCEDEFNTTWNKIKDTQDQLDKESRELKQQLRDTHEDMTSQVNETQRQLNTRSDDLKSEVNKNQDMTDAAHKEQNENSSKILDKVQESTTMTKNMLLQKIDKTSYDDGIVMNTQFQQTQQRMDEEHKIMNDQFMKTQQQLDDVSKIIQDHFEKTYVRINDESSTIQTKVKDTKDQLTSEAKQNTDELKNSLNNNMNLLNETKETLTEHLNREFKQTQEQSAKQTEEIQTQLRNFLHDIFGNSQSEQARQTLVDFLQTNFTHIEEQNTSNHTKTTDDLSTLIKSESSLIQDTSSLNISQTQEKITSQLDLLKTEVTSAKDLNKIEVERAESSITQLVREQFTKQYDSTKMDQTSAQAELKKILMDEINVTKETIKNESDSIKNELGKSLKFEIGKAKDETQGIVKQNHNEITNQLKDEIMRLVELNKQESSMTQANLSQLIKDTSFDTDKWVKQYGNNAEEELKKINLVLGIAPPPGVKAQGAPQKAPDAASQNQLVNYILESQKKVADLIQQVTLDQSNILKTVLDLKDNSSGSTKIVPLLTELKDSVVEQGKLVKQTNEFTKTSTDTGKLLGIMQDLQESAQESSKIVKQINDLKDTTLDQGKLLKNIYDVQKASDTGKLLKVVTDLQDTAKEQNKLVGVIQDLKTATAGQTKMPTQIQAIQDMTEENQKMLKQIIDLSKACAENSKLLGLLEEIKECSDQSTKIIVERLENNDGPDNKELAELIQNVKDLSDSQNQILSTLTKNSQNQIIQLQLSQQNSEENLSKNYNISESIFIKLSELYSMQAKQNEKANKVADVKEIGADPEKMAQYLLMIKESIDNQREVLQKVYEQAESDPLGQIQGTLGDVKQIVEKQKTEIEKVSDVRSAQYDQGLMLERTYSMCKQMQDQTRLFQLINDLKVYALDHTRLLKLIEGSGGMEGQRQKSNVEQGRLTTVEEQERQEIKSMLEKNQQSIEKLREEQTKLISGNTKFTADQTALLQKIEDIRSKFSVQLKYQEREFTRIAQLEEKHTMLLKGLDKKSIEAMQVYERKFNDTIDVIEKKVNDIISNSPSPAKKDLNETPEFRSPEKTLDQILMQPQLSEVLDKRQTEALAVMQQVLNEMQNLVQKFQEKCDQDVKLAEAAEKRSVIDQKKLMELLEKIYKYELQCYANTDEIVDQQKNQTTKFLKELQVIKEALESIVGQVSEATQM